MKTVAVITEYNPFHNGHLWQLRHIREVLGDDVRIVVLMSGNFVQRGEAAVLNREARTKVALACGASLVLEIPLAFATASARDFADGAVRLLSATGICRDLVCGAENPLQMQDLKNLAHFLNDEPEAFRIKLAEKLSDGMNFAAAREETILELFPDKKEIFKPYFREPNNILALEYQMAIERENLRRQTNGLKKINLRLLPRKGSEKSADLPEDEFASASSIRLALAKADGKSEKLLKLEKHVPPESLAALLTQKNVLSDELNRPAMAWLLARSSDELLPYRYMEKGLANRLINTANELAESGKAEDLRQAVSTRYYSQTRVQRAILSCLLGIQETEWRQIQEDGPAFVRVCGADKHGRYLLKLMRKLSTLPTVTKNSDLLEVSSTELASAKAQQNLALRGEKLYRILACETSSVFDSYTQIY